MTTLATRDALMGHAELSRSGASGPLQIAEFLEWIGVGKRLGRQDIGHGERGHLRPAFQGRAGQVKLRGQSLDSIGPRLRTGLLESAVMMQGNRPDYVIGVGGAHSITRHAMNEPFAGTSYEGHFLAADIAMTGPFPRGEAGVVCSPNGFLLLAPLPGGRWISFQDLEEHVESVSADDVVAGVLARLDGKHRPTDVGWFSAFRMHRRIAARLTNGRCFLIGDAAHLSSPFGGEGLNAGLHDAYDLAWKLALVLRGHAGQSLLDHYTTERRMADRHILDVSDQVHRSIMEAVQAARQGSELHPAVVDPLAEAQLSNARAMIDVDYAGSPLVADHGADLPGPRPGQRYPDWRHFAGTSHRVLIFGSDPEPASLTRLNRRWSSLVQVSLNPAVDPARAGVPQGGLILVRPDGHLGFRFLSAGAESFAALDRHLSSYLAGTSFCIEA